MRRVMIGAALASLGSLQAPAATGVLTLKDLNDMCSASDDVSQTGCNLFILGAVQGLSLADGSTLQSGQYIEKKSGRHYCVPDDTANAVMRDKVLAMIPMDLKAWPDDAQMPAISWVGAAITKAWSCP